MNKISMKVKGMHCKSCEFLIKETLEEAGAKNVKISHLDGDLSLEADEKLTEAKIKSLVKKEGYEVV